MGADQYYPSTTLPLAKNRLFSQYHAQYPKRERNLIVEELVKGPCIHRILFVTIGLGTDCNNIRGVIHIGVPHIHSLIYPYLFYCVSVWASTYQSNLRRLITPQKRVVRIMSRTAFDAHTEPLFKNLRILNLKDIYKLQIGKFMYQ